MSIHDFHSKLMSGNEEGTLFEALRSLRKFGRPAQATSMGASNWSVWTDSSGTTAEPTPGWTYWQETEVPSEA